MKIYGISGTIQPTMKKTILSISISLLLMLISVQLLMARGDLRKLTGIGDSLTSMDKASAQEGKNYLKAKAFIESADIKQGLSADSIIKACGEPVARAVDGTRWVYKPPSSTFFEGEKIYFIFDKDEKLLSWGQVYQD